MCIHWNMCYRLIVITKNRTGVISIHFCVEKLSKNKQNKNFLIIKEQKVLKQY